MRQRQRYRKHVEREKWGQNYYREVKKINHGEMKETDRQIDA